jgi:hypothetical protein
MEPRYRLRTSFPLTDGAGFVAVDDDDDDPTTTPRNQRVYRVRAEIRVTSWAVADAIFHAIVETWRVLRG